MEPLELCLICGKPVPDYKPEMCCNGRDCTCRGLPINPPVCSDACETALYENIGETFDERRELAGIMRWDGE